MRFTKLVQCRETGLRNPQDNDTSRFQDSPCISHVQGKHSRYYTQVGVWLRVLWTKGKLHVPCCMGWFWGMHHDPHSSREIKLSVHTNAAFMGLHPSLHSYQGFLESLLIPAMCAHTGASSFASEETKTTQSKAATSVVWSIYVSHTWWRPDMLSCVDREIHMHERGKNSERFTEF